MTKNYSGSDWLKSSLGIKDMSPLGEAVGDLLGDLFFGIYHLNQAALRRVEWSNTHHIIFYLRWKDLSTVDFNNLTILVVLAHDRMIRVCIDAAAPHTLRLLFHQRTKREGDIFERYPTIEDHIKMIREHYADERLER